MLKIGDFSKLARVTITTLCYYDDLGLLKPVKVDEFTGYRYYSANQLTQLYRIIAMKDMGLSLEEISRLLQDNVSIAHILDLLHIKQEKQKQKLEIEVERLKRVEEWLKQTEKEGKMPNYEIVIKKIPPLKVVSIRTIMPNTLSLEKGWRKAEPVLWKIVDYIFKSGSQIIGPPMAIFYSDGTVVYKNYNKEKDFDKDFDMEIALPVSKDVPPKGEIICKELPGYDQMVTTIHKGSINSGGPAQAALAKWMETNNYQIIGHGREIYLIDYQIVGPNREIYFGDTHSSSWPKEFVTEIQYPVTKA